MLIVKCQDFQRLKRILTMAFGLQCWDGSGRLVVDLSDYNCRFIGTYTAKMASGAKSFTQSVPGINASNSFAIITHNSFGGFVDCYCVTGTNSFTLYQMNGYYSSETFTVEVYRYA